MAAPVITGFTLTPASPKPGDTLTAVVTATDPDNKSYALTITVTDSSGATTTDSTRSFTVMDQLTFAISSSPALTWTQGPPGTFTTVLPK